MAASNLFKNNDESMSNVSGICNPVAINDSSNSVYTRQGSTSSDQNNEMIDLNETNYNNLEMNLNQKNNQLTNQFNQMSQLNQMSNHQMNHLSNQFNNQLNSNLNSAIQQQDQAIDIALQNYLFDYKSFTDDTKSMNSVMTSKSTRETFDCLSRFLPWGIFLLIVFIMIHFVLYVRDIEPFQSITEVIVIGLACSCFVLSSAFIVKIFCDTKGRNLQAWTGDPYSYSTEEYVYTPNNFIYNNGVLEPNLNQPVLTNLQSHLMNSKNFNQLNMANEQQEVIRKQPHYYIDAVGNRIYATQLAGLEFKNKRFTPDANNQNLANLNSLTPNSAGPFNQHRRTNSFDQRYPSNLANNLNRNKKVSEQCIQTINLIDAKRKESLIKETST